ncbi:PH domain-containing protein [Syncephalis fuscata]|nr:PH domain-containing protein [Syncephalis fuscata]
MASINDNNSIMTTSTKLDKSPSSRSTTRSVNITESELIPPLLNMGERVLHAGVVYKRRGLFSKRRLLVLTDHPRLIYADDHRGCVKGTIYFTARMLPEFKDPKHFFIHTPSKTHYFEDTGKQARFWVETINQVIKEHFGDTF